MKLIVTDVENNEITLDFADVKTLREEFRLDVHSSGPVPYGGSGDWYVIIETSAREYIFPRNPKNDPELLNFILRNKKGSSLLSLDRL